MRGKQLVMAAVIGLVLGAPAGSARAGALVSPEILQGSFFFNDSRVGPDHCSDVEMDGAVHTVTGIVTGVGLSDDTVTLTYSTPFVDRVGVRERTGRVNERVQAGITVDIQPGAGSTTLAYTGTANPDRGKVAARVVQEGNAARVAAGFKLDTDLTALSPAPDATQLATILAAFTDRKDVKIQQKSGRVSLRQEGLKSFSCSGPGGGPPS